MRLSSIPILLSFLHQLLTLSRTNETEPEQCEDDKYKNRLNPIWDNRKKMFYLHQAVYYASRFFNTIKRTFIFTSFENNKIVLKILTEGES